MKNKKITSKLLLVIVSIFTLAICINSEAQEKKSRKQIRKERAERTAFVVDSLIKAKDFKLTVYRIVPIGAPSVSSSDGYNCTVQKDSFQCYFPYFGQAHRAIMGGMDNLAVDIKKQKIIYQEEFTKKDGYLMRFNCYSNKTKESWTITLQIFDNGNCNIGCATNSKDNISYLGTMEIPDNIYIP